MGVIRECIYYEYERSADGKTFDRVEKGHATFHQFGTDYEEFCEGGPGVYSTAIIELPDGTVKNVPVENISFVPISDEKIQPAKQEGGIRRTSFAIPPFATTGDRP